ncbi:multicopper oxidase-domain-containing protein [Phyllosticta citriasiana]|uniref:Multicopper oxidase-domain-containing protein n=1 Tax=Phyllosticta citriasiana TaxID=595635 RepID=A0ABR1KVL1_9PEZI
MWNPLLANVLLFGALALAYPQVSVTGNGTSPSSTFATATPSKNTTSTAPTATCSGNTASDRSQWCDYDLSTNYYEQVPNTGVTVEYWFDVVNMDAAPDGYMRPIMAVNGTVPGPAIECNWGDTVVVHVRNSLTNGNGTGIHWHGIRQNWTNYEDGVPSVTQCPIAPGDSMTYTWRATAYGSTWYHSHFSLQAWEGVFGPITIHGPASANYDVDLGHLMLSDWSHETSFGLYSYAQTQGPPPIDNGLLNGMNVWNNSGTLEGSRWETNVSSGSSYRLRLVNTAIDTHFKFGIDNHTLTVIAMDLVPIVPYTTEVLDITMGQRYDVIVNADQGSGDYWVRAVPQSSCSSNDNPDDIRGILRYDTSSTATPTTAPYTKFNNTLCVDEPYESLVPYMSVSPTNPSTGGDELDVTVGTVNNLFKWYISNKTYEVPWEDPTLESIYNNDTAWTDNDHVVTLDQVNEWVYFVIETSQGVPHPMHLHGHDFWVLATGNTTYDSSVALNTANPPRRDTVNLPTIGFVVIAFLTDNPGAWLMHCHIGWHTSEGLAMQFVERASEIGDAGIDVLNSVCDAWDAHVAEENIEQDDSGV